MIYLDIETLPTQDESIIAEFRKSITVPATYKKQESIDKWMDENAEDQLKELVAKTSFDGLYGRIACIAWALDDGKIMHTTKEMNERECLHMFFDYLDDVLKIDESLCGHNIAVFDLTFLKHRAIINNIKPPIMLLKAMSAKPWDNVIQDTMLLWSTDKHRRGSMDRLCRAFGIKGKEGFDGSMVAETWPVDPQKVIDYCCDDIRRTREIYKRITFQTQTRISKRIKSA
jgi:hypothetical protein